MLTHTYTLGLTHQSVSTAALPTRPPGDASWPSRCCFKEQTGRCKETRWKLRREREEIFRLVVQLEVVTPDPNAESPSPKAMASQPDRSVRSRVTLMPLSCAAGSAKAVGVNDR